MSQTVEFEYAIGDRVRVHQDARSKHSGRTGVVVESRQTKDRHEYRVELGQGAITDTFRSFHLERDAPGPKAPIPLEPASAPASAFPRVIGKKMTRGDEFRTVEISPGRECIERRRANDAMGVETWVLAPGAQLRDRCCSKGEHAFPRVVWQRVLYGSDYRIVRTLPQEQAVGTECFTEVECFAEVECIDATGQRHWKPAPWGLPWVERMVCALVTRIAELDGSNQNT